jgi:hypothetical protein
MSLADPMAMVLHAFEPAFSRRTWSKVQVLIIGTFLARGRPTVAAALRQMGLHEGSHFSLYHHVLSCVSRPCSSASRSAGRVRNGHMVCLSWSIAS